MLACDAFSPRGDSVDLHFHQHHPPLGGASKTGLKKMHQWHMQLAKSDTLYVHGAVSCSVAELNSKLSWGRASKYVPFPSASRRYPSTAKPLENPFKNC